MQDNYFSDWLSTIDENVCNKCNIVTNTGNSHKNNILEYTNDVTVSNFQAVTHVTNNDAITIVTNEKGENCNSGIKVNSFSINKLDELLRLLQLLQQKNGLTCMQEMNEAEFEPLKRFFAEDWGAYKSNNYILKLWEEVLHNLKLMEEGIPPLNFTITTTCANCGTVLISPELANGGFVLRCPWCFNKELGLPIPK